MDAPSFFDALIRGLEDIKTIHYTQLCSACIVIFDHLITLDAEINLIWPSSWTLGKTLFLLNRYYSLAAVVFNTYALFVPTKTNSFCLNYYKWQGWTGLVACMLAEAILQTRLYALYSLNKKILAFMLTCFALSVSLSAYIMGFVLSKMAVTAIALPADGMFCLASDIASNFYMFWIPLLAFECLLCGLALFKGLQTLRRRRSVLSSGRFLIVILIRDSIIYFFAICATYLTSLLIWMLAPITLLEVPIGFSLAMSCVLANRVLLNVREAGSAVSTLGESRKPVNHKSDKSLVDMSFCSPGTLSQFEMGHLRSMRAEYPLEDIFGISNDDDDEYDVRKVPWVVR